MHVLILAGGFATRLWPLTIDRAKPLLPLAGQALVSHLVDKIPANIPIIVSTNAAFADDFKAWREKHSERNITIYIEDTDSDAGKKGALKAVSLVIDEFKIAEDFLVLGGDNFFDFDLQPFLQDGIESPFLAAHDIHDLEMAKKYGVVVSDGDKIIDFQEKPLEPKSTLVGTLCYYFPSEYLQDIHDAAEIMPDKIGGIFEYFLEKGYQPKVHAFKEYWNDVGSFQAYIDAHMFIGGSSIPEKLKDTQLNNIFSGVNYVEDGVEMKNVKLSNSIVLAGTSLENCSIEGSIIDNNCEFKNVDIHSEIIKRGTILLND